MFSRELRRTPPPGAVSSVVSFVAKVIVVFVGVAGDAGDFRCIHGEGEREGEFGAVHLRLPLFQLLPLPLPPPPPPPPLPSPTAS